MSSIPLSIVIPCFNEAATVVAVLTAVRKHVGSYGSPFEIIVIDDASTDRTYEAAQGSGLADFVIRHRVNRGYGASLKDGIRAAKHAMVLVMDADGQHLPEEIDVLLEDVEGYDMVVGARRSQGSHHWRMFGKLLLRKLCEFMVRTRIPDLNSGFRVFKKSEALKYLHLCSEQFSFTTSLTLAFLSERLAVKFVPVKVGARQGGQSQVRVATGFATLMLILRIIGTFNPLPIFMPPTILLFFVGFSFAAWGVIMDHNISDIAVICLVMSALLFCFGLLADQLALLRREINKQ
jgi:glycosyltransferase involved in cell wall biosynthesis